MAEYIPLQKKYYDGFMIHEVLDEFENDYDTLLGMLNRFASMDGANVQPVKTGWWDRKHLGKLGGVFECSECHGRNWTDSTYCPNCGSRNYKRGEGD